MHYLKRNTRFSILAFLIIVLSITISISTLAKIEVYFSHSDNPQKAIIKNINQAETFINIAMYIFTDREIALPLVKARERGVKVRLYLDKEQVKYQYSQSRFLVQKGIKARISTNNYIMHNKFAIIDNRILLTGSYNWTFSAHNRNDENLMVIDDPEIIEIFQNQFEKLWFDKFSLERTRQLYQKANVNFPLTFVNSSDLETQIQIIESITPKEAYILIQENKDNPNFIILDMRTPEEFLGDYIENAVNLYYYSDTFRNDLNKLDKNKTYLIYCRSGRRSRNALNIMKELDFREVYNMLGGISKWKSEVQPININTASQEELTSILQISEPLAQKIIALREELGGFKDPQDLTQLSEITNIEWREWKVDGMVINVE